MGNSPSTTGLDWGGAHGRRDMTRDGSGTEQRPANYSMSSSESELTEEDEDERFDKEFRDKLMQETNRKSSRKNAPEPSYSHTCMAFTMHSVTDRRVGSQTRDKCGMYIGNKAAR